ncbi:zinc ABC transporter substrate-binding protein [soil metagenome]
MKFLAVVIASLLVLTGCSAPKPTEHRLSVVASTDVYGSIARAIGGTLLDVTSIIDDPAQDPHSFEPGARAELALSKADIVIKNGAGYDDFVDTMLSALGGQGPKVLDVAELSGRPIGPDFNEHLWYDFPSMEKLVIHLVSALIAAAPADANRFENNAENFIQRIYGFEAQEASLKQRYSGKTYVMSEPVPGYMLEAVGLKDVTPQAFSRAIEAGTDVPPTALRDTLDLFTDGGAHLLAYNKQTAGPQTQAVLWAAHRNSIPVVGVTETLPPDLDYVHWMTANLNDLASALKTKKR